MIIKDETGKILLSAVRMVLGSVEDPYVLESGLWAMICETDQTFKVSVPN